MVLSGRPAEPRRLTMRLLEDRAHRAVDVADRNIELHRLARVDRIPHAFQDLPIEVRRPGVGLLPHATQGAAVLALRPGQQWREVQSRGLPVIHGLDEVQVLRAADHFVHRAEPEPGHDLPGLLGDEGQEADHVVGLAVEAGPQIGPLRGDAHRAGAQVALPHQQAPQGDQRRGAEAEPLGAQQGGDHHVAAGLQMAVHLDADAVPQAVEHQRLLGLGQADLPGRAGVLDRRPGAGAGAAVVAADEHLVGVALGHAGGDRAHAHLGDQLHRDLGLGIGALQVVDQLRQVLDGIDVVVRRRRDQRDAGRRVAQPGDLLGHLVARKLAALARLGPLGHLDLQDAGVGQVFDGHAEAGTGHLLDGAVERIAVGRGLVARRVLAALARVRHGPQPVHGQGQRLVGLLADRAVRHGAAVEPPHDPAHRLDLLQRHRLGREPARTGRGAYTARGSVRCAASRYSS